MKKFINAFCAAAIVAMTTGCADYGCDTYYNVINQTGHDITIDVGSEHAMYKSTKVKSGEEGNVYHYETLCSKRSVATDYFSGEDTMQNFAVKIDGKPLNDDFWKRKYWNFTAAPYKTTFTMTLTKELLAGIGQHE